MTFTHERAGVVWVDLEQPTRAEVHAVASEFGLSHKLEEELANPTPLPLVTGDANAALLVLHFPSQGSSEALKEQEIDFVVGKHFIITVRYDVIASVHELRTMLEGTSLVGGEGHLTTDAILELLFNHLFASLRGEANLAAKRLEEIEDEIFTGDQNKTIRRISEVNRDFLRLHAGVASQEEALMILLSELERRAFFGPSFSARSARIIAGRAQLARLINTHRAIAAELRETNAALLNAKQNEIIKRLTVITFIMLPLGLIASVFEVSVPGIPFSDNPHAFWIIVGMMTCMGIILTLIFVRRKWL